MLARVDVRPVSCAPIFTGCNYSISDGLIFGVRLACPMSPRYCLGHGAMHCVDAGNGVVTVGSALGGVAAGFLWAAQVSRQCSVMTSQRRCAATRT